MNAESTQTGVQNAYRFGACVVLGALLWMMAPPEGMPVQGWRIFSVFISVIVSLVLRPYSMGTMVLFGLVTLTITKSLTIEETLSGYGDKTVWLVVAAFLIAGGVIHTGFGRRVALMFVGRLGKSTLGLGYSLCGAELLLGPVVPSNTARGGGILSPIVLSLCNTLDSHPHREPERAGKFLVLVAAHANLITAAMFLTGMAANPVVARAAKDILGIEFGWGDWALGAIVPGLVSLTLLPPLMYFLSRPELKDTRAAQAKARQDLREMGPWKKGERVMAAVFVLLVLLWSTFAFHGLHSTLVAWIGVCLLLLTRTEKWQDVVGNDQAWDTFIWLGGLLTMANSLKKYEFIDWFAATTQTWVVGFDGMTVIILLALIYFYSMYCFSMLTAHIVAMVAAFFAVALEGGAPAMVTIALLAYFSNLCACTTNYSTGPVVIYFGLGFVSPQEWFARGFQVSLFHLSIWFGIGLIWWKILGWW